MRSDIYSEVADMDVPPIPNRGYKEDSPPVHAPSAHTIHGMTTLERKSGNTTLANLKHNIKDKLNIGNNNEDLGTDTSHIPGFKTRLEKKPGGPKDKPNFWRKILK